MKHLTGPVIANIGGRSAHCGGGSRRSRILGSRIEEAAEEMKE
jgi:hypothetical protein